MDLYLRAIFLQCCLHVGSRTISLSFAQTRTSGKPSLWRTPATNIAQDENSERRAVRRALWADIPGGRSKMRVSNITASLSIRVPKRNRHLHSAIRKGQKPCGDSLMLSNVFAQFACIRVKWTPQKARRCKRQVHTRPRFPLFPALWLL